VQLTAVSEDVDTRHSSARAFFYRFCLHLCETDSRRREQQEEVEVVDSLASSWVLGVLCSMQLDIHVYSLYLAYATHDHCMSFHGTCLCDSSAFCARRWKRSVVFYHAYGIVKHQAQVYALTTTQ
jgi:hypothetical protein